MHGEWARDTAGCPGGIAVVVEPAHPRQLAPLAVAAFELTARESAVVRLIDIGADTRSIANDLGVTSYTVQDHLKSVFARSAFVVGAS